jgi:starch phosphorylase
MKVLVNGGLNLSELDGWWAEAYTPDVGWAIGDRQEHGEDPAWDQAEAEALYAILEQQVVPEFYERDSQGIPVKWVARIRESMARLTPAFSASRAIFDYTERHYLPAAASFKARAADGGKFGAELLQWRHDLAASWDRIGFGSMSVETTGSEHHFSVQVFLHGLSPDAVRVELYANPTQEGDLAQKEMRRQPSSAPAGEYLYSLWVPASRPAADYTPRIVPYKAGAFTPLEVSNIVWQR